MRLNPKTEKDAKAAAITEETSEVLGMTLLYKNKSHNIGSKFMKINAAKHRHHARCARTAGHFPSAFFGFLEKIAAVSKGRNLLIALITLAQKIP